MGKSRTESIKNLADPVKHLLDSNRIWLKNFVHNFSFPEPCLLRLLAGGLDYILLLFVTGLVTDLAFANWNISIIDYLLMMGAITFLYFVIAETVFGYTAGKRVFDLKVVSVNGDKPAFKSVVIRNVSKIFFVLLIADIVRSGFTTTNLHQRYTDKIAQTTVEEM